MSPTQYVFAPSAVFAATQKLLPSGFTVRPLSLDDYDRGFLAVLGQLTTVGTLSKAQFTERFQYLQKHNDTYFTIVIEDTAKKLIIAAGTVLVERKFVHANRKVGHIEDIVSHEGYRGKNLGKIIIETLKNIGKAQGCYKIILDCSEKNVPFYEKCGFKRKEVEMAWYIEEPKPAAPAAPAVPKKSKL